MTLMLFDAHRGNVDPNPHQLPFMTLFCPCNKLFSLVKELEETILQMLTIHCG